MKVKTLFEANEKKTFFKRGLLWLGVFAQVSRTFVGLFFWLTREYLQELRKAYGRFKEGDWLPVSDKKTGSKLGSYIDSLSGYEQTILHLYYNTGMGFEEIGLETGIDAREVVKIHNNVIHKIRAHKEEERLRQLSPH